MKILDIINEIANESSTNQKMVILKNNKDNELLKRVIYLAESRRIKFWLKQIPIFDVNQGNLDLKIGLEKLNQLIDRKITGHAAQNYLKEILESLDVEDSIVLSRIIQKDLKIGMGAKNINKVLGSNFIEETSYMGAQAYSDKLVEQIINSGKAFSQTKMDGRYCNAVIKNNGVYLESRGGEPSFLTEVKFVNELSKINSNVVLNGELVMKNISRYESNGIIASLITLSKKLNDNIDISKEIEKFNKNNPISYYEALDSIQYVVWDIISEDEYFNGYSNVIYYDRFENLKTLLSEYNLENIGLVESIVVSTKKEAIDHFKKLLSNNEEGTILKSFNNVWKSGKPNTQCKVKIELDFDLKIVSFNLGTKGSKNENLISSINVESSDGLLKTSPAGITEDDMEYITMNQEKLLGTIVKVKCSGTSHNSNKEYSLLHPVFIEFRTDKTIADSLGDILNVEKSTKTI